MLIIDLLFCFLGNFIVINAQTCYYPDQSVSPRDTPCHSPFTSDGFSACCASADICLDNGLCLAQTGSELISRGSCTDESWQSPQCSQYCEDGNYLFQQSRTLQISLWPELDADVGVAVNTSGGATVQLLQFKDEFLFCCSAGDPYNNTCMTSTKGSHAPFPVEAGHVIFNRTSGSTSPNNTNVAPITITATSTATVLATASASNSLSTHTTPSSSKRGIVAGAVVSGLLGLVLLVTLGLLWRERMQKQSLKKEVQEWEGNYGKLVQAQNVLVDIGGAEHQAPPQQLDGWRSHELYGQSQVPHQLDGGKPGEIDGTQVF